GNVFYSYGFEYYELPVNTSGDGYDAFSEEVKQWDTSYAPGFDALTATNNFGIDGSLYAGLTAKIPNPFGEDEIIASAGLKAGVGMGWSYSDMGLMDLNGDGLGDIYQRDGQNLNWYPNNGLPGYSFGINKSMSMPGFNSLLNYEDSRKLFLGATASGAGATADYNHQWVWTDSLVTFSDVDADGLVDIVWRDKDFWLRNVAGTGFSKEYWDFDNTQSVSNTQKSGITDEFNKGYYQQSPLRRWTSRWPGTITIKNKAHLITPFNSHDGLILETWYGASEPQKMEFHQNDSNTLEKEFNFNAQANQAIYFYLDPKEDERGDRVFWESQLQYENINYFHAMKNTADYCPPEENNTTLPHNDQRLANLYNRSYESGSYVYKLKTDWENYANVSAYEAMVEYGYFIPKTLGEKTFNDMFNGLGDDDQKAFTSEQISLSMAWNYNKLTQNYDRINNQADWVIKKHICQFTSLENRRELAFYELYDGRLIPLKNKSLVMNNSRFYSNSIAKITTEDPPENPGIYNLSKGYLLDRLYVEDGTEAARLWLQENQNVFVEEITAIPDDLKILDVNASSVKINLHNVEITYSLSNFDSVIEEMPADFYENTVNGKVIGNNKLGLFDFYSISSDTYKKLEVLANKDQAELLKANYVFNETDEVWQLKKEITNTSLIIIIGLLQNLYPLSTGPFYDTEVNIKNIICLDDEQYNKLINFFKAEEQNPIRNAFNKTTVDNINYYLPTQNHQDISQQLSIYFRENIAFPWYEQKDDLRVLKKLEQQEEIQNRKEILSAFWNELNLGTWKYVIKKVDINPDVKLNVENSILPANQSLLEMAIGVENIQPGSEVGKITFSGINSQGQTTVYQRFIPQFNSTQDFNAAPHLLSEIRKKILAARSNSKPDTIDDFSGGYMGWEYNTWKSYKDFDPALVQKINISGQIDDMESRYTLGIQSNQQGDGINTILTTIINKTGKEYVTELDTNTWIGEISSYNAPNLQSDGTNLNIEYTFAPYIKADEMAPSRKGGDFIHETFQGSGSASRNTLTLLNKSLNDSNEVTVGYNNVLFGGNISINSSTSMQYIGLADFNGDRYPDMLNTPTDHKESKTFMPGTKKGLADEQTITVPFDNLNRYRNLTAGFGITGSTGSMAIEV
ncbi:MAG: hypothetical protein JW798_01310, partial [Prolixibacteraceae bacterium]|nr:hypothetical protein [Prolixibacteraceae bacterium]